LIREAADGMIGPHFLSVVQKFFLSCTFVQRKKDAVEGAQLNLRGSWRPLVDRHNRTAGLVGYDSIRVHQGPLDAEDQTAELVRGEMREQFDSTAQNI
jgi:hypothetical protein